MPREDPMAPTRVYRVKSAPWRAITLALAWMLSMSCQADGRTIAQAGAGAVPACQTCHGAAGEGIAQAGFPRLAGLGAPYMQRQLAAFADGTRVSDVMMPIAKALSTVQATEVSAFYAGLPATAKPAAAATLLLPGTETATASVGSVLATRGRWAEQLPACEQCHGPGGRGGGPDFPPLTGQSSIYLANQLKAWQTGTRPPGPMGLMSVVARKLTEAEVMAIADHYAALATKAAR